MKLFVTIALGLIMTAGSASARNHAKNERRVGRHIAQEASAPAVPSATLVTSVVAPCSLQTCNDGQCAPDAAGNRMSELVTDGFRVVSVTKLDEDGSNVPKNSCAFVLTQDSQSPATRLRREWRRYVIANRPQPEAAESERPARRRTRAASGAATGAAAAPAAAAPQSHD